MASVIDRGLLDAGTGQYSKFAIISDLNSQKSEAPTDRPRDGWTDQTTNMVTYCVACTRVQLLVRWAEKETNLSLECVGEGAGDLEGDQVLEPGGEREVWRFRALLTVSWGSWTKNQVSKSTGKVGTLYRPGR